MKNSVDITIVLDRSGSMESIKRETIRGFNHFIQQQNENAGCTRLTLVKFDHEYEMDYEGKDIDKVKPLDYNSYVPRGMTALLDAIGKTIKGTRERIKKQDEENQPDTIIFVIITDGQENYSKLFTSSQIFEKIEKMQAKHHWQFVFLGANQDAIHEAAHLGIPMERAMTFSADKEGIEDVFESVSHNIKACMVSEANFVFTEKQREKQKRTR